MGELPDSIRILWACNKLVRISENSARDMFVRVRWQGRKIAVPLAQLVAIGSDESTEEAIGDWHYWVARGYIL
jgi:hypothetical protein